MTTITLTKQEQAYIKELNIHTKVNIMTHIHIQLMNPDRKTTKKTTKFFNTLNPLGVAYYHYYMAKQLNRA